MTVIPIASAFAPMRERGNTQFAYVCLGSNNLERSAAFYDATLGVLGIARCDTSAESETSWSGWIGWGLYENAGAVQDALWVCRPFDGATATAGNGVMIALRARTWREVDDFHAAALAHGGTSEGPPGLRLAYNPDFYAAYVRDPDGNKLAVVCRGFTTAQEH
jgi:catechol 2,3-dioxygenase-like lactoylglutathione lyase family enzyme